MTLTKTIIICFLIALVIILERAFPFILFSKKNPPKVILFIKKYIPPMVMVTLLLYCIKDINFVVFTREAGNTAGGSTASGLIDFRGFVPYSGGVISTILLHLYKRNSLISIFGGTIIYMILIKIL